MRLLGGWPMIRERAFSMKEIRAVDFNRSALAEQ
jgi:hypothetical protein